MWCNKVFFFDLDGTIYHGESPIQGAKECIEYLQRNKIPFYFLTNNAMRTQKQIVMKLEKMGFSDIQEKQVFTSAMAASSYAKKKNRGNRVFCIGEEGLHTALIQQGFEIVEQCADQVIVGLDRSADFMCYTKALHELQQGACFIATNPDRRVPQSQGDLIGNGAIIQMLEYASEKKAEIVGKPSSVMMEEALQYAGIKKEDCIVVGDNLETDVLFGLNNHVATIFVTTGLHTKEDAANRKIHPDWTISNLKKIME